MFRRIFIFFCLTLEIFSLCGQYDHFHSLELSAEKCVYLSRPGVEGEYQEIAFFAYLKQCERSIGGNLLSIADASENTKIKGLLNSKNIPSAYIGYVSMEQDDGYYWYDQSTSGFDNMAKNVPTNSPILFDPISLIVAVDGRRKKTDFIDFAEYYVNHMEKGNIVAFTFGCQDQSVVSNYVSATSFSTVVSKLQTSRSNCKADNTYTLSNLMSDVAYYYYSAYPVIPPSNSRSPVIVLTTDDNADGVIPLSEQPNSPVIFICGQTDCDDLNNLALPKGSTIAGGRMLENDDVAHDLDNFLFGKGVGVQRGSAASAVPKYGSYINGTDGKWYEVPRNPSPNMHYLCESGPESSTEEPSLGYCPSGWFHVGDKCYLVHTKPMDYESATEECEQNAVYHHSATLAYIETHDEMTAIFNEIEKNHELDGLGRFWIGLRANVTECPAQKSDFSWSNGRDLLEDNHFWRKGYPRTGGEDNCVALDRTDCGSCGAFTVSDQSWVNTFCEIEYPVICYMHELRGQKTTPKVKISSVERWQTQN